MVSRSLRLELGRPSSTGGVVLSIVGVGVGLAMSTRLSLVFLVGTCFLMALPVVTRNGALSALTILWGFTAFLFIVIWLPRLMVPQYALIKDALYIVIVAVVYIRRGHWRRRTRLLRKAPYLFLGAYVLITVFYWLMTSSDYLEGLVALRSHIAFVPMAVIVPLTFRCQDVRGFLVGLTCMITIIAGVHVLDFALTYNLEFARGVNRALFGFLNPNVLGTLYASQLAMLLSLDRYVSNRSRRRWARSLLLLGSGMLSSFAFVITLSRRNVVSFVLAILLGYLFLNKHLSLRRRLLTLTMVCVVLFLLLQFGPSVLANRLRSTIALDQIVDARRMEELQVVRSLYLRAPGLLLTGRGFGVVGSDSTLVGSPADYYHNYYLTILADSGVLGLALFVVVSLCFLREAFVSNRLDSQTGPVLSGLFQATVVIVAGNLFGTTLASLPINVVFWCYLGLIARVASGRRETGRCQECV